MKIAYYPVWLLVVNTLAMIFIVGNAIFTDNTTNADVILFILNLFGIQMGMSSDRN